MRKTLTVLSLVALICAAGAFGAWYYWTHRYDNLIAQTAEKYSLDPALIKAIVYEESFFNPKAQSSQKAVGLMQVTPIAAQEWMQTSRAGSYAEAIAALPSEIPKGRDLTFEEAFSDPVVSLHVGCWYLHRMLNRYADEPDPLAVALAAYNAGPTNVERWVPNSDRSSMSRQEFIARIEFPSTRQYVQNIIERYDYYKRDSDLKAVKAGG